MTITCGYKGLIIGAIQCFISSFTISLLFIPPVFCDTDQHNDSIINIHPVALHSPRSNLSIKVSSSSEKHKSRVILNRLSRGKSLTNPVSISTSSISNNGLGTSTTAFNSSSGRYIINKVNTIDR